MSGLLWLFVLLPLHDRLKLPEGQKVCVWGGGGVKLQAPDDSLRCCHTEVVS